ncbi:NAD-dependent succinate-semialdehyde dehydrogenase [Phenylobacterium immobile]|uniref:NAD-dependent succinate-semialdehyde dehydrogenase n=1 Tax=Phenylobacterium immobile TaxID=21 RepID=UPI000B20ADD9|nr:NAD-dependent succinate-semialdehyde dehydrogenase [Phenylobacterium immobile]
MDVAALKREACPIGGEWRSSDAWIEVDDPATGAVIGRVPDFGPAETREAIAAAQAAMPEWAARTAKERAVILRRTGDLMVEHADALAALMTSEQGKPLSEARNEVLYAASFFEWFAEEARRAYGEIIPGHQRDRRLFVIRQPVGVVAAITPWNFPLAMITRKIAPALAAGCACVVKPAHQTPFSALAIAVLAEQAGLPVGLLNIVTGLDAAAIGETLTASSVVRKVSFTGSTATGAKLFRQSADTIKKLSLELGGNAPFLVFDDADLEAAVEGAIQSKFRNAGQTCVCTNRFYVQAGIHDRFVARLAEAMAGLPVGAGASPGALVGPLIEPQAVAKVERHVADALAKGATLRLGGARHAAGERFYQPTLLEGVAPGMTLLAEETFGPLAGVVRFTDEAEAIRLANDSEFGLAAYVFTRDASRLWRVSEALEVGMVGANTGLLSTEVAPFGGVKQSGLGREGSRHGLDDYMELKYICMAIESGL